MSKYEEYISDLSDSFKKLEESDVLSDFAAFNKKYSDFLDLYDEKFGKNENPESEKVLEELDKTFTEKREKLLEFFSEQTRGKDIAGLFKGEKLDEDARSFILTQVDNHLMVTPAQPIIPSDKDLESFYRPLYNKSLTTTKLELNSVQIQACALAGLELSEFENNDIDTIKAAWEKKGFIVENGFVFRKGANAPVEKKELRDAMRALLKRSHPDKHMENEGYYQSLFELVNNVNNELSEQQLSLENKKNQSTELAVIPKTEIVKFKDEQDTPTKRKPAEHTDMHWIDEKIRDYTEMKNAGNVAIKEFSGDKTAGTFTAEIDNGTVTYTSPNDVSVTKDSSYKVFDTMMKEPSNAGKAVRLPEDATAEFRTNLFVAAVLNGHKVNGAEGLELDEATLAKIGLTPEQKAQVLAALPKQEEKAPAEKTTQEKPAEEKPSEKVTENEALPGPYNPAQHRINHILERKNMLDALAKGTAENVKPVNPDKPTFIFKNAQNHMKKGGRDE